MFIDAVYKHNPIVALACIPEAIIRIQNIRDYLDETPISTENLVPVFDKLPFDRVWFEWLEMRFRARQAPSQPCRCACFCCANGVEGEEQPEVVYEIFVDKPIPYALPVAYSDIATGFCTDFAWLDGVNRGPYDRTSQSFNNDMAIDMIGWCITVVNSALAFYHCKNVQLHEEKISEKLIKARRKRSKPYFERTYTLSIEPMKKVLGGQGEVHTKGLSHAFHLCRGHLKTYTDNQPLFGKITGTFFWHGHIRGNKDIGKISKEYSM